MGLSIPMEARTVLDFWFGEIVDGFCVEDRSKLWFRADASTDREISRQFGQCLEEAAQGRLVSWCKSPRGRLALIVLLDQFSRNVHRGTAAAFAQDGNALEHCLEGLRLSHDRELAPVERTFFYLPLEHSEDRSHQDLCVAQFEGLLDEVSDDRRERLRAALGYAVEHRDIIRRFGRFPHRNRVLGRESSSEERRYLDEGGHSFGQ